MPLTFCVSKKLNYGNPEIQNTNFCLQIVHESDFHVIFFKICNKKRNLISRLWKYQKMGFLKGWGNFFKFCVFSFCGVPMLIHNSRFWWRQHLDLSKPVALCAPLGKVVGLTGFVIIHVFIASFSPAQGEHNQIVNTKFARPVNEMPMSSTHVYFTCLHISLFGVV